MAKPKMRRLLRKWRKRSTKRGQGLAVKESVDGAAEAKKVETDEVKKPGAPTWPCLRCLLCVEIALSGNLKIFTGLMTESDFSSREVS